MSEKLFDLEDIVYLFKTKFWIIILVTSILTGYGYYKTTSMTVSYQATAKIFVGRGDNLLNYYSKNELDYYKEFMNTFSEIIKIDDFIDATLKKYNIDRSPNEVKYSIGFTASSNSPIFTVTYRTMKREGAEEVLSAVCQEFNEQAKTILPDVKPRIIDSAKVYPIYPNKKKVIVMYFGIGFILSIGVILMLDYLDNTVKSKRNLEKLLPIPFLGDIPKHEKGFKEEKC
ncbi:MAG: Wzz/FepE/Etk N-terminal domain-containing protein [Clostridium sp.]|nr:Wzz/FepE/Etk N-terminal domain-containing protein [Clostridium sp.]MDU7084654.1 Wzz/FepE/Etk N-terminal domain-containing protein [Clostridium sp.]